MLKVNVVEKIEFTQDMDEKINTKASMFLRYWYSEVTGNIKNELKSEKMTDSVINEFRSSFVDSLVSLKAHSNSFILPLNKIPGAIKTNFIMSLSMRWSKMFNIKKPLSMKSATSISNIMDSYFPAPMLYEFYQLNIKKMKVDKPKLLNKYIDKLNSLLQRTEKKSKSIN